MRKVCILELTKYSIIFNYPFEEGLLPVPVILDDLEILVLMKGILLKKKKKKGYVYQEDITMNL